MSTLYQTCAPIPVTQPCAAMKEAMMSAPLGDDVLGDEPTVQKLEALAAAMLGMGSGCLRAGQDNGQQIGMAAHTSPEFDSRGRRSAYPLL
ncbi:MAG: beta-eliminating lyase-related protein [Fimbriimonadaceae bacterium]